MEHRCPGQQMDGWTNSEMADERGSHNFFNNDNFIHGLLPCLIKNFISDQNEQTDGQTERWTSSCK